MQAKEWHEDAVEKLKFLVKDGFSARQIADRIGYSKSAVCGKANRLGLSIGNGNNVASSVRFCRKKPIKAIKVKAELPNHGSCQWPIDDAWCGCTSVEGKPYCVEHMKVAYTGKPSLNRGDIKKILWLINLR